MWLKKSALIAVFFCGSLTCFAQEPVPGVIQSEDYSNYFDTSSGNTGAQYRNDDVDIQQTTDTNGGFNVGWIDGNEWLEYEIDVTETGSYRAQVRVASKPGNGMFTLEVDGITRGDAMVVPMTGGWQNWQTMSASLGQLSTGSHTLRVQVQAGGFNLNWINVTREDGDIIGGDQCDTTAQCRNIFGPTATDCLNSRSDQSVCMCGATPCGNNPTPEPTPVPTPTPTATPLPTPTPLPTFLPTPTPLPTDQCNTTSECKAIFGPGATDCLNSRSDQSVCMCGSSPCQEPTPTATPVPTPTPTPNPSANCQVSGDLAQWHRVAVTCSGYSAAENNNATFTNHRFDVTFSQGSNQIRVPGHFAADGEAANSGAGNGDKWRAYFSPPTTGNWNYAVSFRQGNNIAVSTDQNAGQALSVFNGKTGQFNVGTKATSANDMRGRGLLRHISGERYLRAMGDNTIYIEAGMDSPENIFGYSEFDNTTKHSNVGSCKGLLHDFAPHFNDWQNGDPTWKSGKGKSLIGLVNYISSRGVNAAYVMAMTVNGDGCDAHPWTQYSGNRKSFDVSKLDQWEIVFSHMTERGLLIHFMTQETENDQLLNNGNLGFERKLYYREMISRFGHHPALQWNLGEENTNTAAQQKSFADFIRNLDPYNHPILMHTYPGQHDRYEALLGHPTFDGPTFQFGAIPSSATGGVYGKTLEWINKSTNAGRPWVVTMTEASGGQAPQPNSPITDLQRIYWMWANVMAGGAGFEWYLKNAGSGHAYDLAVEDLREFDSHWQQSGHFARFFRDVLQKDLGIDLQDLRPSNGLTSTGSDWVLAQTGQSYLIFLRNGGTTQLTLPNGSYDVLWFNPRTGQKTNGSVMSGTGSIGFPPSESNKDWVVVVTRN